MRVEKNDFVEANFISEICRNFYYEQLGETL